MRCVPSDDRLPWNLLEWVLPVKRVTNLQITALLWPPTHKKNGRKQEAGPRCYEFYTRARGERVSAAILIRPDRKCVCVCVCVSLPDPSRLVEALN